MDKFYNTLSFGLLLLIFLFGGSVAYCDKAQDAVCLKKITQSDRRYLLNVKKYIRRKVVDACVYGKQGCFFCKIDVSWDGKIVNVVIDTDKSTGDEQQQELIRNKIFEIGYLPYPPEKFLNQDKTLSFTVVVNCLE